MTTTVWTARIVKHDDKPYLFRSSITAPNRPTSTFTGPVGSLRYFLWDMAERLQQANDRLGYERNRLIMASDEGGETWEEGNIAVVFVERDA